MQRIDKALWRICFILMVPLHALGACFPDIVDYTLEAEVERSPLILIATPTSVEWVKDKNEPDFYAGSIYQLDVQEVIYQKNPVKIELYDPNDSGRFAPDIGKKYLLIFYKDSSGSLSVDYCGNSGLLSEKADVLKKIRNLISKKPNKLIHPTANAAAD